MDTTKQEKYFPVILASVSALIWLISNINCPLRFTLDPLEFTKWHISAIIINFVIMGILLVRRNWRKFSFYPLLFNIHPILYVAMTYVIKALVGVDYSDITVKFSSDIIYFCFEILFFLPMLFFLREKNPLNFRFLRKDFSGDLDNKPVWFKRIAVSLMVVFLIGVYTLAFVYPSRIGIPPEIVSRLRVMQIIFAVTLGFKEEFIFRWLLQNRMKQDTGNILIAIIFQSVVWMLYHIFFGEGTGTGVFAGIMTLFAAGIWGYFSYAFKNIWFPFLAHIGVELFGFYLMYQNFIYDYMM